MLGASLGPAGTGKVPALGSDWDLSPSPAARCHVTRREPPPPASPALGGECEAFSRGT